MKIEPENWALLI